MPDAHDNLDADSLLLLFVTGELEPQQSAELERQLAGDAVLRARAEVLRGALALAESELRRLDDRAPMNVEPAVRRAGSAMRQWQARSHAPVPAAVAAARPRRFIARSFAAAAIAATIVISVTVVYRNMNEPRRTGRPEIARLTHEQLEKQAVDSLAFATPEETIDATDVEPRDFDLWEVSSAEPIFNVPLLNPETAAP